MPRGSSVLGTGSFVLSVTAPVIPAVRRLYLFFNWDPASAATMVPLAFILLCLAPPVRRLGLK